MSLYRCAACGSPNVVTDTQTGGISYNYKKGIAGTIVLGAGGAVAGVESSTQRVYKCQECGMTLTYAMPEALRDAIDRGLANETARSFLYAEGYGQLTWSVLKKQYKNIEEGFADRMIADRANREREGLLSYATATQEEFDSAVDLIVDFERRLSCNGSIYDKLPDDAFSDMKPMTLVEYYVWQDAIALLIENAAKYFPDSLDSLEDYRGLKKYRLKQYFGAYLYEKLRIEYGRLPEYTDDFHCEDLKNYSEENPFVLYFADKYIPKSFIPFGQLDRKAIPWEPDRFEQILLRERDLNKSPCIVTILFKFTGDDGEEILVSRKLPRYTVENGRLGFWRESNPHNRVPDPVGTMEDYFTIYPEKHSEFNEKIAVHKKQLAEKSSVEAKLNSSELAVSGNQNKIKENKTEIARLQNKIIGKKAALAKAAELEQEIQQLEEKNSELEANISALKQQLEQILDDKEFYKQLAKELDYFIAWRWIEETTE